MPTEDAPAAPSFILSAQLDAASFDWLDGLRRQHFPPARNLLAAHLTMFHRLSPQQADALRTIALPSAPIALQFDAVMFLGFGNAMRVTSPALVALRAEIRAAIGDDISRQDAQRWRPHVTIQNKVTADDARALNVALARDFHARSGEVIGLQLWRYLGGPWALAQSLRFSQPCGDDARA